ncbi:Uncharacterised protein [Salmonella enterica subsp. enterica serovar Typhimurium str. DT104]|nr:Uncharacterised protein [Salmonella enterica subsp. enterica serovar Typhimurium str. DT104]
MFCGKNQIADNIFPRLKAFFRHFNPVVETVAHQVRQRVDNAFDQAFIKFSGAPHQRQLYLLAQFAR